MNTLVLKRIHKHLFLTGSFFVILSLAGCSLQKYDSILPEEKKSIVQSVPEQSASEPQGSETEPEQDEFADMSPKELVECFYYTMEEDAENPDNQLERHLAYFMCDEYYCFLICHDPRHPLLNGVSRHGPPKEVGRIGGTLGGMISGEFGYNNYQLPLSEIAVFDLKEEGLSWPPVEPNTDYYRDLEEKEIEEIEEFLKKIYACIERPVNVYGRSPWCIVEISDDTFILLACYPGRRSSAEKQESEGSFFVFQKSENSHYKLSSCLSFQDTYGVM